MGSRKFFFEKKNEKKSCRSRTEIADLEAKLAKQRADNSIRNKNCEEKKSKFRDAHVLHAKLQTRVKMAQNQSSVLKNALETGFAELEEVINLNSSEFEAAGLKE